MSIPMSNPDPTAAMRQARQKAHLAAIDRDAVIEVFVQCIRDRLFEETNALTQALWDLLKPHPEDR